MSTSWAQRRDPRVKASARRIGPSPGTAARSAPRNSRRMSSVKWPPASRCACLCVAGLVPRLFEHTARNVDLRKGEREWVHVRRGENALDRAPVAVVDRGGRRRQLEGVEGVRRLLPCLRVRRALEGPEERSSLPAWRRDRRLIPPLHRPRAARSRKGLATCIGRQRGASRGSAPGPAARRPRWSTCRVLPRRRGCGCAHRRPALLKHGRALRST